MHTSSMFQVCNQVQVVVWIIISKERISINEFMFDPRGFMNLSTLEDGYDLRTNHLKEGGNDMILKRDSCANYTLTNVLYVQNVGHIKEYEKLSLEH